MRHKPDSCAPSIAEQDCVVSLLFALLPVMAAAKAPGGADGAGVAAVWAALQVLARALGAFVVVVLFARLLLPLGLDMARRVALYGSRCCGQLLCAPRRGCQSMAAIRYCLTRLCLLVCACEACLLPDFEQVVSLSNNQQSGICALSCCRHVPRELLQLTLVASCLGAGWISGYLGTSEELGAFLAGAMVSLAGEALPPDAGEWLQHQIDAVQVRATQ